MDLKRIKTKIASSLCLTAMSLSMLSAHSSTPLPTIIVSAEELLQNTQLENLVSTVNVTGNAKIVDSRVPVEVTLSKLVDKESLKNIEEATVEKTDDNYIVTGKINLADLELEKDSVEEITLYFDRDSKEFINGEISVNTDVVNAKEEIIETAAEQLHVDKEVLENEVDVDTSTVLTIDTEVKEEKKLDIKLKEESQDFYVADGKTIKIDKDVVLNWKDIDSYLNCHNDKELRELLGDTEIFELDNVFVYSNEDILHISIKK